MSPKFGLVVVGDEILSGKRVDKHLGKVIELLAAWLNDEPLPLPRAVAETCHPNRFLLRKLIRGQ